MKVLSIIFNTIVIIVLLAAAGLFLAPMLPIANPINLKIVESGSMEPAIMTGALVVVMPASSYAVGDVITFNGSTGNVPTTHRIDDIEAKDGVTRFVTKGDANEEIDTATTLESAVIGKVLVDIPSAGYILDFARQPIGFALLIVLPALMIIFGELEKIWTEIKKRKVQKKDIVAPVSKVSMIESRIVLEKRMIEIAHPIVIKKLKQFSFRQSIPVTESRSGLRGLAGYLSMVLVSVTFAAMSFTGSTVSYFNDTESSVMNFLQASAIDFNVLITTAGFSLRSAIPESSYGDLVTTVIPEKGSEQASYSVSVEKISGSDVLCDAVHVVSGAPVTFEGPLLHMAVTDVVFNESWTITTSLSENITGYLETDFCEVDIVYSATQNASDTSMGYSDQERIRKIFYAPELKSDLQSASFATFVVPPQEESAILDETDNEDSKDGEGKDLENEENEEVAEEGSTPEEEGTGKETEEINSNEIPTETVETKAEELEEDTEAEPVEEEPEEIVEPDVETEPEASEVDSEVAV